ncbi:MAG: ABC transporter substrate-binding protein [Proteobacteria bacterium]|nr:ABC transporter substrate-binding protein [Pseudomonadota bacterium]MBU4277007.1 ABC transporter substrate-binding protein [Pseudomonadota bacterium]MBU4383326.1 ABC transporter substrate-binding protein [Pseudomonadota bacterium]MBU4606012.1 ABC transporter substrate-binding protein [Pseudomonadota bacterium]MCG2764365.1 ABC transporter substrate-binding protein [Desulfarculaceae bacterium]
MKSKLWLLLALTAALGLALGAGPAMAKTIKIGLIDCYSGPPSTYTNDVRDAFKLQMDKVNAKGGVWGNKFEIVTRDTKFKVDLGLSQAKELIMRENVSMLVGTINSALALALADLCQREKIPFFATFSKSAKISGEKGNRYVFQITENTAMIGKAAAAGLAKKPYVKYWIAGDDYEYGHAVGMGVWNHLKKLKPEVQLLGQSWWKVGEPDFTPYITAILAAKPDAVIVATGGRDCVPFLKAAQATGFNKKVPFFMHTAAELATLRPVGKNAPEGVLGTSNYFFYHPQSAANIAFVKEFQDAYKRLPTVGALYGYITAQLIIQAYQKTKSLDTEKFIDAVEGLTVQTPVGPVKLRPEDHQALLPMYMGVTKKSPKYDFLVADGIVTISPEEAAPDLDEIKKARGK